MTRHGVKTKANALPRPEGRVVTGVVDRECRAVWSAETVPPPLATDRMAIGCVTSAVPNWSRARVCNRTVSPALTVALAGLIVRRVKV